MAGLRVFISHSAKDDVAGLAILDALVASLAAHFDVLLDRERLKAGTF